MTELKQDKLWGRAFGKIHSKIKFIGRCLVYTGYVNKDGYGRLKCGDKHILVHRFIYEAYKGEIPEGKIVCHECDNPACVRPSHLFLGTHKDNIKDCVAKGRHKGHLNSPFKKGNNLNARRKTKVCFGKVQQ